MMIYRQNKCEYGSQSIRMNRPQLRTSIRLTEVKSICAFDMEHRAKWTQSQSRNDDTGRFAFVIGLSFAIDPHAFGMSRVAFGCHASQSLSVAPPPTKIIEIDRLDPNNSRVSKQSYRFESLPGSESTKRNWHSNFDIFTAFIPQTCHNSSIQLANANAFSSKYRCANSHRIHSAHIFDDDLLLHTRNGERSVDRCAFGNYLACAGAGSNTFRL